MNAGAATLAIGGLVPFSTTDWPGRLAAVVFCQGCPWRCGYCHNPHLQPAHGERDDQHTWVSVQAWLATRPGLLDAVVFSGGEPTAQPALQSAIVAARALGFAIGMHTAGIYPRRLARLLDHVDWVGLDIKAPVNGYETVTGVKGSASPAFECLDILSASHVAFEVRTTVHPALTPVRALEALGRTLADRGVRRWVLQPFRARGCADQALVCAPVSLAPRLIATLSAHVPEITVR